MSDNVYPVVPVSTQLASQAYAAIPQHYAHPGLSLMQLFSIVWAHRRLTLACALGTMLLGAVVSQVLPKTYNATAMLMVDYEINDPLGGKEFPVSLMGSYMATQIELIKSPAVLLPVIEKLKLTENEDYTAGYKAKPGSSIEEYVRRAMEKHLVAEQGAWGSQLITISYSADDASQAALIANTIAEVYSEQQFLRMNGPASERTQRYTQQLDQLKKRVDEAQERLTAFRQKNGLIESDAKSDLDVEKLSNLEHRLLEAQEQRRTAELRTLGDESTRDAVLGASSIQQLKSQLAEQQSRLAELSQTLGPRHPDVMQLRAQINSTRSAISAETATYTGNVQTQIAAARSLEAQLRAAVDAERERVLEHRKLQDESAKYELELESAQTLYHRALDGYDNIVLISGGGYNNVHLVSRAVPPVRAAKPTLIISALLGLFAGAFLGLAGPLVYELLNRRVRCRDDLDRDFGIPVLIELGPRPATAA